MLLNELLKAIQPVQVTGDSKIEITGVNIDSRLVEAGQLFMAMRGTQTDGHAYIPAAIQKGATAILCEDLPEEPVAGITYIQVKDSEDAVGKIATTFYGNPTEQFELVGVTGTNGKTTIATLLYNTFRYFGYKVGLISTVCNYIDDQPIPTEHTTPDPITLNRLLGQMADEGCKYVFMEVSSHSIAQKRISGLKFAGGIFTNLTRDHLDYHKTVENYLKAKKKFFDDMPKNAFSLTNLDDKNGLVMTQNTRSKVYTYSLRSLSDFKGRVIESHFEGMLLDFNKHELAVQFIGKFNASNLLAVFGAAVLLGKKEEEVLIALSTLHPVAGRFDAIRSPKGVTAIVDYAHTPDALINVLNAIHGVLEGKGKVITVVGAGGNRDKGKRPIMAKEAAKASDRVIITSDNPRFEEPQDIINDMLAGLDAEDMRKTLSIADRKEAIRTACMLAEKGDVILLAVFGAAVLLGKKEEEVLIALSTLHPVAGRFDAIRSPKGVTAIVDYAHTPDALINVLNAIHGVLEGKGKVITVVGAGGNRDKGKRPIMAKEAAKASDRVIITSDNPRFEEPQDIINDMLAGLDAEDMRKTLSIADRKEAIRTACMLAEKGDVILVAGKGHENYQEIRGVKHHFDDKEVLKEIFN